MIHMNHQNKNIQYLLGNASIDLKGQCLSPYDPNVCEFLSDLSSIILGDDEAKKYPDIVSFGFWCRKANIQSLRKKFDTSYLRLPLGIVFQIAPANVPINFAYSYVFSLLAGNSNIVRVPSKDFEQIKIVCRVIQTLFKDQKYIQISKMTIFVRYGHDEAITANFSSNCSARIIWGGDSAIKSIRKFPIPTRSVEIVFADRYSICVIAAEKILSANRQELRKLAENFYNDTYLIDQNACSSPHLIVWLGREEEVSAAKNKFWESIFNITSQKYDLQPVNGIEKYCLLCEKAIELDCISNFEKHENFIYRVELTDLPDGMDHCRGKYGFFYEYTTSDLNSTRHIITEKYQTLTYFGVDKNVLRDYVFKNRLPGLDRIVPIGSALDIGVIWDGYDIVSSLSRIVDVK